MPQLREEIRFAAIMRPQASLERFIAVSVCIWRRADGACLYERVPAFWLQELCPAICSAPMLPEVSTAKALQPKRACSDSLLQAWVPLLSLRQSQLLGRQQVAKSTCHLSLQRVESWQEAKGCACG